MLRMAPVCGALAHVVLCRARCSLDYICIYRDLFAAEFGGPAPVPEYLCSRVPQVLRELGTCACCARGLSQYSCCTIESTLVPSLSCFLVPHFREVRPESLKVLGMGLQLCGLQVWCWLVSTVLWLVLVERQLDLSSVTARLRGSSCVVLSGLDTGLISQLSVLVWWRRSFLTRALPQVVVCERVMSGVASHQAYPLHLGGRQFKTDGAPHSPPLTLSLLYLPSSPPLELPCGFSPVLCARGARAEVVASHSCRGLGRGAWSEEEVVIPT
ncbi:hypothetical protein Taro_041118 [Colocasia esculenta]|uniref:Uncharacterized protein n=1 Tax=Colocasia esculenta TaxID=4460 RepID=A0A843WKP7_COLES|nr:hypothetical protein [Colocasia esculenta]